MWIYKGGKCGCSVALINKWFFWGESDLWSIWLYGQSGFHSLKQIFVKQSFGIRPTCVAVKLGSDDGWTFGVVDGCHSLDCRQSKSMGVALKKMICIRLRATTRSGFSIHLSLILLPFNDRTVCLEDDDENVCSLGR